MDISQHHPNTGWIEVITGSMFSGKSEELIRRLRRAQIAKRKVQIFKPKIDNRYAEDHIISHSDMRIPSVNLSSSRELLAQVLPDTEAEMTWVPSGHGMRMELARDVPDQISSAVRLFVATLFDRAGMSLRALRDTVFAVHPGGPKIIDRVRDTLELGESQVATSRRILLEHGNMSSATLPHIWAALLADQAIAPGTRIASLAVGPGLTTCGIVLEKQ